MSPIIGIDLGTTNSGVAMVQARSPIMLPNGNERIIPSVVGYTPDGQWLVGTPARNQLIINPENTVRSIKREMGTDKRVPLAGRAYSPPEISAFILRELKRIAETNLGTEVSEAVITVPAYFSDAARQATQDAGRIAGFNVRRIINEPTAAALAYGLNMAKDQLVLVYDLGGGTFDVSLVELMGGIVEVRASHGNTRLGGDDFDDLLAGMMADRFKNNHGVDLRPDRRAWARLQRAAEAAKIELSSRPFAWIKEEYLAEKAGVPLHLEEEVSRHEFVSAIEHLLDQTLDSIDQAVEDAGIEPDEINQVLLVGGSTRIPAVWELVDHHLGIEPQITINPEEVVALGAGVQAAIIAGEPIDTVLVDVTPHSLGIAVAERRRGQIIPDRYSTLIRRNTAIPVSHEEVYSTLFPDQDTINIQVYQGEKKVASENTPLGDFLITGLEPEAPDELAAVTVRFDFGVDGILQVTARDRRTGKEEKITVAASPSRLSEAEILEASAHLAGLASGDAALPTEAQALVRRAEQLLSGGQLTPAERDQLQALLAKVRAAYRAGDLTVAGEALEALLDFLFDREA